MIAVKWRRDGQGRAYRPRRVRNPATEQEWVEWERQVGAGDWEPVEEPPPPETFFAIQDGGTAEVQVSYFAADGESSPDDTGASGEGPIQARILVPTESAAGRPLTPDQLAQDIDWLIINRADALREEVRLRRDLIAGTWRSQTIEGLKGAARKVPKCHSCGPDRNVTEGEQ